MEQEPILNEHNKQEYPPMHIDGTNTLLKNKALQKCGILLLVLVVSLSLTSCLNNTFQSSINRKRTRQVPSFQSWLIILKRGISLVLPTWSPAQAQMS